MRGAVCIYPFNLEFINNSLGHPAFAPFNFIFNKNIVNEIFCGISSRFAGNMKHQDKDRQSLFLKLGINPFNVYSLKQIHSRSVIVVDKKNPPPIDTEADGMVTQDREITLSVTVADCLPVFLYDTKSGAFGLVHSGWKGTGIALAAVNLMQKYWGTEQNDIAAILGPCIGSCCYKVDLQRASVFETDFGSESVRKSDGSFFLDLKTANIKLLENVGVKNIAVCQNCTFCDERLGSFRREGSGFTHMAALIHKR